MELASDGAHAVAATDIRSAHIRRGQYLPALLELKLTISDAAQHEYNDCASLLVPIDCLPNTFASDWNDPSGCKFA